MLSLRAVGRATPEAIALVDAGGELSFIKLFDRSEHIADELRLSCDDPRPIAYAARNDVVTVALTLALLDRGIPAFPLNPRTTVQEQERLVSRAGARWLEGTNLRFRDASRAHAAPTPEFSPIDDKTNDRPQLLIASSGSTGTPKIVCLSHRALETAALAAVSHLSMTDRDRWLLSLSLGHIGGIAILLRCLVSRAAIVLAEPTMSAVVFADCLRAYRPTLASLVPTQLVRLLSKTPAPQPTTLRAVLLGGARAPLALLKQARASGWPVLATYGMSECGSQIATQPLSDLAQDEVFDDVGNPLAGIELRIEPTGRVCVRGGALFDRYLGVDQCPFDVDGWFVTEDLGSIDSHGRLVTHGRSDEWIASGGETISSLEIESELTSLPDVRAAAVVALPDPDWGQLVAAAVVLDTSADWLPSLASIKRELSSKLASYKLPKRWLRLPELPQLPNGKLDRRAVRALFVND